VCVLFLDDRKTSVHLGELWLFFDVTQDPV
jgi:hypothetical protein